MDSHPTLKLIMDTLFSGNTVKNWSVFSDERCGDTVIKIWFTKSEECSSEAITPVAYKRKSQKQSRRNYQRKVKHEEAKREPMTTRSKKSEDYTHVELTRSSETDFVSETPSISPVVCEEPDIDTNNQSLSCDSPPEPVNPLLHGSADTPGTTEQNHARATDSLSSILSQYKNIERGRELNIYQLGRKCSACSRSCDLNSESEFGFRTLSCNHHNAIICTNCYFKSGHLSRKCKMKKVIFHV